MGVVGAHRRLDRIDIDGPNYSAVRRQVRCQSLIVRSNFVMPTARERRRARRMNQYFSRYLAFGRLECRAVNLINSENCDVARARRGAAPIGLKVDATFGGAGRRDDFGLSRGRWRTS